MEMGHSSQYGQCAILVFVDLSFGGALGEVWRPRFGNQGIRVHISQLTVDFTLLFRAALPTSLGSWVLAYEVANYVVN